jgi:hypothetical protein
MKQERKHTCPLSLSLSRPSSSFLDLVSARRPPKTKKNTKASCVSKITWIDGTKGILRYRGYDVADLATLGDFDDAAYALLHGDLPAPTEKAAFRAEVSRHTMVRESVLKFFQGFHADAHPMSMLCSVVAALSSFYSPACEDISDPVMRHKSAMRLISKVPTLAAAAFRYSRGQPFVYPRNSLGYAENFLHMVNYEMKKLFVVEFRGQFFFWRRKKLHSLSLQIKKYQKTALRHPSGAVRRRQSGRSRPREDPDPPS